MLIDEGENGLTIQTVNEKLVIPLAEVESRSTSPVSMMPEGMLNDLTPDQVRDLVAYLASPMQVPLGESVIAPQQ